jgi:hypothetical protein
LSSISKTEYLVNPQQASKSFKENGFIHIRKFFPVEICNSAISAIEALENSMSQSNTVPLVTETINGEVKCKYYQGIYSQDQAFRKFFNLDLLLLAKNLLGIDEVFFADLEAHIRNPGGGEIPRHQDNFYFNLSSASGMTTYIALTNHDKNSGGLNYKRYSHMKVVNHSSSNIEGFSSYIDADADLSHISKSSIYSPVYGIGDISVHHPNNIHWAEPCPSDCARSYALSARVFNTNEKLDPVGLDRYRRLLSKNRSA